MRKVGWFGGHAPAGEQGTSAIEFAFVLPFIVIVIYFLLEGAILLQTWARVEHASREAARYGAIFTDGGHPSAGDVEARATQRLAGLSGTVAVSYPTDADGTERVHVTVTHVYSMKLLTGIAQVILGHSFGNMTIIANTHMRLE
jgi:Flp pilus assembly protein TadG